MGQCAVMIVMIVTIVIRRPGIPVCFFARRRPLGSRPTVLASRARQDAKLERSCHLPSNDPPGSVLKRGSPA